MTEADLNAIVVRYRNSRGYVPEDGSARCIGPNRARVEESAADVPALVAELRLCRAERDKAARMADMMHRALLQELGETPPSYPAELRQVAPGIADQLDELNRAAGLTREQRKSVPAIVAATDPGA